MHVEWPPKSGQVWFTIRMWKGWDTQYNFDIVDVPTRRVYAPRYDLKDLKMEIQCMWTLRLPLISLEETAARARNLERLPGENGEERYQVPGGSHLLFHKVLPNGRRVVVADLLAPRDEDPGPQHGPRPRVCNPFA